MPFVAYTFGLSVVARAHAWCQTRSSMREPHTESCYPPRDLLGAVECLDYVPGGTSERVTTGPTPPGLPPLTVPFSDHACARVVVIRWIILSTDVHAVDLLSRQVGA